MKKQWWNNKIFYQIYPKSFCDSNQDGIGDLRGIISKLDYIRSLGVDLIWLSPVYQSPFQDQGYDISDYYAIDPCFGTMEDMDELIAEAKKRDMGILMDLVVNHCSDEHLWFQKCIQDPEGPYGDYFYLSPPHKTNNLRSYFGGSVWSPLPGHPEYQYLHMFDQKQPDLNWENKVLREEIFKMVNWWLDKGLAGFRIDAIMNIKKVLPFHDYTPDRGDGMASASVMISDAELTQGGVHAFLRELNERCFKPHNAVSIGEVFDADGDKLRMFIGENGHFSSMFDFAETCFGKDRAGWHKSLMQIQPDDYKQTVFQAQALAGTDCLFSNVIENHDEPRGVSHYLQEDASHDPQAKKLLACMYYLLRGLPFIYQGQELGMENMDFTSIDQINDINTLDEYQNILKEGYAPEEALRIVNAFSRDNARTPMQWNSDTFAGFSSVTPWLPLNPNYTSINAADQEKDSASVLHFYRRLAALRKDSRYMDTLVYGSLLPVYEEVPGLMAYLRMPEPAASEIQGAENAETMGTKSERRPILVLGNFNGTPLALNQLPASPLRSALSAAQTDFSAERYLQTQADVLLNNYTDFDGTLKPYQAVVFQLK